LTVLEVVLLTKIVQESVVGLSTKRLAAYVEAMSINVARSRSTAVVIAVALLNSMTVGCVVVMVVSAEAVWMPLHVI
jgi:hypothetical protein